MVPNEWTCSVLIDALCRKGKIEEARLFFQSLIQKGIKMNEVVYTSIMDGLSKTGKFSDAQDLMQKMVSEGLVPDVHLYSSLVDGLCREKKLSEAMLLLDDMMQNGVQANAVTYNHSNTILIDRLLREFGPEGPKKIFNKMVVEGIKPDVFTYTVFIRSYCQEGRMEDAESMIVQMIDHGVCPSFVTYNTLIKGYANLGQVNQAFASFKSMVDNGCKPNTETYTLLLRMLLNKNTLDNIADNALIIWNRADMDVLEGLMEEVVKRQCTQDTNIYDCFIRCLCRFDRFEEAKSFLIKMQRANLVPSMDVYTCMIECSCRRKLLKEALAFLDSMTKNGYLPHLGSYRLIICALCEEGSFHTAKQVFGGILSKGYNFDEIVGKILIDGLLQIGNTADCSGLLLLMEEQNCRPSAAMYARLPGEVTIASEIQEIAT
ncbi:hypothetical protein PR202_gb29363 [Eleusine coracana subsp. coracana]|uniref:Pentatricopeptide repeat-containing protein n=1 Tax=Eleusine coracana subsp. coracana TaxID=191504 RepID=A0AAV5FWV9_ELECO|nr:hypothetical protein PR202_gb29363 [Eleusine coracana subsp. coracana]